MHFGVACYDQDKNIIHPVQVKEHLFRCAGSKKPLWLFCKSKVTTFSASLRRLRLLKNGRVQVVLHISGVLVSTMMEMLTNFSQSMTFFTPKTIPTAKRKEVEYTNQLEKALSKWQRREQRCYQRSRIGLQARQRRLSIIFKEELMLSVTVRPVSNKLGSMFQQ